MQLDDYFHTLARYHAWATRQLLDRHLAALPDADWRRDCGLFFGSIHRTLNHLLVADDIWYSRFAENRSPRTALDEELHADRDELCNAISAAVERWSAYVPTIDASRWQGDLTYARNNGETVRIAFAPALGHVFNHATHHRAQITAALTAMSRPCPELDWVRMLQQEPKRLS